MTYGGPDWLAARWPIRTQLGTNQIRYLVSAAGSIDGAGGTGTLDITVPTGYRQTFSKIVVLSPVSCIQYFYVQIDSVTGQYKYYDISGEMTFNADDAPTLDAGQVFSVIVVNNDTSSQTIRINLSGLYEEA